MKIDSSAVKSINSCLQTLLGEGVSFNIAGLTIHPYNLALCSPSRKVGVEFHTHPTLEYTVVLGGEIRYFTENMEITLGPGGVLFMPSIIKHRWVRCDEPFLLFTFQAKLVSPFETEKAFFDDFRRIAEKWNYHMKSCPEISDVVEMIIQEAGHHQAYCLDAIHNLVKKGFISLFRKLSPEFRLPERISETQTPKSPESAVITARLFILDNIGRELKNAEIADHLGISERHLNRIFHSELNLSVGSFINSTRMHFAQSLLRHTKNQIKSIAFESGFSDTGYFCRVFKRNVGLTPSEYRRKHS